MHLNVGEDEMGKLVQRISDKTHGMIKSREFRDKHRVRESNFTRIRRMGFVSIMGVCINFMRKSMQLEIDRYMELTDPQTEKPMSKQAFSKARQNISPDAFKELFEGTVEAAFADDAFGRWKGYRVFAADASTLQLPKSAQIKASFPHTQGGTFPLARVSILCDVITGLTIHAVIDSTQVGERDLAMRHLAYMKAYNQPKTVYLFDRGYPSKEMIEYLEENGFPYVMRLQKNYSAQIDQETRMDLDVSLSGRKVRVIKLTLPNGEPETLITNLARDAFKTDEFQELYHLRWGIETKYNTLKNKLDIQSFSGRTMTTLLQDFYATMFLLNFSAAMKIEVDEIIAADTSTKNLKHEYMANENILIGKLKDKLILILLYDDPEKRAFLLDKLIAQLARFRTAIIPNRHFERTQASLIRTRPKKAL